MSFVYAAVLQSKKMLLNLDGWLEKAAAHGKAKGYDPAVLLSARLAPDQYPLLRQIQSSCDQAKFFASRMSGKEAPKHPDTEQTFDEARARIRTCVAYLETFKESDFAGAEARTISLAFLEGKTLTGLHYAVELSLPNQYFHMTTAYAIMRNSGVDLGKMDFLGHLTFNN